MMRLKRSIIDVTAPLKLMGSSGHVEDHDEGRVEVCIFGDCQTLETYDTFSMTLIQAFLAAVLLAKLACDEVITSDDSLFL